MNDNEKNIGEDMIPEAKDSEIQGEKQDIFAPVASRDVYSYTKDEEVTAVGEEAEAKEEYSLPEYDANPFDSFPKNTYVPPQEPVIKAEEPAFNPYAAPKKPENDFAPYGSVNNNYQHVHFQQPYNFNQQPQYRGPDLTPPLSFTALWVCFCSLTALEQACWQVH